ncbi:hypothetical protein OG21DRAFT_781135 [Imleria badia]|nr:hypothetical protein OG21DRAFT_781135 [Imleria badia]
MTVSPLSAEPPGNDDWHDPGRDSGDRALVQNEKPCLCLRSRGTILALGDESRLQVAWVRFPARPHPFSLFFPPLFLRFDMFTGLFWPPSKMANVCIIWILPWISESFGHTDDVCLPSGLKMPFLNLYDPLDAPSKMSSAYIKWIGYAALPSIARFDVDSSAADL